MNAINSNFQPAETSLQQVNQRPPSDLNQAAGPALKEVGLSELQAYCETVYPDQKPLCFRTQKPFYLGGSDPLDYIYIYKNEISPNGPRHWHYVGFGLSDIHDYAWLYQLDQDYRSRFQEYAKSVKEPPQIYPVAQPTNEKTSGYGFELTFRIRCDSDDEWIQQPPKWPCLVMQALARYVFQSKNVFNVGDHTEWRCSLDGNDESRIEHMLMTLDQNFKEIDTSWGKVRFIQLVGVCQEELQAAREWNVKGVLNLMAQRLETGGNFLVTDMLRGESIFELDPTTQESVDTGIKEQGSDMTIMTVRHRIDSRKPKWFIDAELSSNQEHERTTYDYDFDVPESNDESQKELEKTDEQMSICEGDNLIQNTASLGVERGNILRLERSGIGCEPLDCQSRLSRNPSRMSFESESELKIENAELLNTRYYDNIYILINYESAKVLPIVLNGRLAHKKTFTYKSYKGDLCTTFVPENSPIQSLVSPEQPFARQGVWWQLFISDELRDKMIHQIVPDISRSRGMDSESRVVLPKNYSWPEHKFHITIVKEVAD